MKITDAKKVLKYLNKVSETLTTKAQFDELADIMNIIEKEIESKKDDIR